jgi:hypothetical protein
MFRFSIINADIYLTLCTAIQAFIVLIIKIFLFSVKNIIETNGLLFQGSSWNHHMVTECLIKMTSHFVIVIFPFREKHRVPSAGRLRMTTTRYIILYNARE